MQSRRLRAGMGAAALPLTSQGCAESMLSATSSCQPEMLQQGLSCKLIGQQYQRGDDSNCRIAELT